MSTVPVEMSVDGASSEQGRKRQKVLGCGGLRKSWKVAALENL